MDSNSSSSKTGSFALTSDPPFRSRRTLADVVAENLKLAARLSYWHRLAVVARVSATKLPKDLKDVFKNVL